MKSFLISLFALTLAVAPLMAEEAAPAAEPAMDHSQHEGMSHEGEAGGLFAHPYLAVKYALTQGKAVDHEGETVTGEGGSGFALDLGTMITEHLAAEFTYSTASNNLKHGEHEGTGTFGAMGLMAAYLHHYENGLTAVVKAGYLNEAETIDVHDESTSGSVSGLAVVVAGEYNVGGHNEVLAEYEVPLFETAKGSSIFVGYKHGF